MVRLLVINALRRARLVALFVTLVVLAIGLHGSPASAASHTAKFTGYAMGNRVAGAGVEVRQGHFANHYRAYCPNDPASSWPFGTRIDTPPIYLHDQSGYPYSRTAFYREDVGDPNCTMGNYWVDIYFGRWETRPTSDPNYCCCTGSPSPGYCYYNPPAYNSCTDAGNFSIRTYTYTGP